MPISAPPGRAQYIRRHIDDANTELDRDMAAALDRWRDKLLAGAAADEGIAGDAFESEFQTIYDIIIRQPNISLYALRRLHETTLQQLLAAYALVVLPEPPTPTLTWEQYCYELDLWWKIEGRTIPKPPFWPQEGGHIDTMPVEEPVPPLDPSMALVPLPDEEAHDPRPRPVFRQRMPVPAIIVLPPPAIIVLPPPAPRPRPILLSLAERRWRSDHEGRLRRSRYWFNFTNCRGLGMRTRSIMVDAGIEDVAALLTMSDTQLLAIHGLGPMTLADIRTTLPERPARFGTQLAGLLGLMAERRTEITIMRENHPET